MEICDEESYDHPNNSDSLPQPNLSMTTFLFILAAATLLSTWAFYRTVRNAPLGYENDGGFHFGAEPVLARAQASAAPLRAVATERPLRAVESHRAPHVAVTADV